MLDIASNIKAVLQNAQLSAQTLRTLVRHFPWRASTNAVLNDCY